MDDLERLRVAIEAELKPYQNQMQQIINETNNMQVQVENATSKVTKSFSKMGGMIKKLLVGLGAIKFGGMALNMASDMSETEAVIDLAFGRMRHLVDDFAKDSIKRYGMSGLTAKQTAGDYMLMSKGMNMNEEAAAKMSINVAKLSSDMASLKNTSQEMARTALGGIWTGVTEPLKKYGIVMTQANLQEFAFTQGIQKKLSAMTQQELVMLRYSYIMETMGIAQGNFTRESMGWAAQTKILGEQWKELLMIIGQGLTQVLLPVLQFINKIMSYLIALAKAIGQVFGRLFGKKGGAASVSASVAPMTSAIGGANNALSNLGSGGAKNLGKVGKAAESAGKKAKGALASFDELNVLTQDTGAGSSGGAGGGGTGGGAGGIGDVGGGIGDFDIPDYGDIFPSESDMSAFDKFFDNVLQKINPFIETIKSINFQPMFDSLNRVWNSMKPILNTLAENFAWILNNILGPFAKWFMEELTPVALNLIAGALDILNPVLVVVSELGKELWNTFLLPIASWTGEIVIAALGFLADRLTEIGTWMSNNIDLIKNTTTAVGLFFAAWKGIELLSFIQQSGGVVAGLKNIIRFLTDGTVAKVKDIAQTVALNVMYAVDFVKSSAKMVAQLVINIAKWGASTVAIIANKVATIASTAATTAATAATWLFNAALAVLTSPITLVVAAIGGLIAIIYLLVKNWDTVKQTAANVWNFIVGVWRSASSWFSTNVLNPIFSVFSSTFTSIKNFIRDTWNTITGLFTSGGKFFSGIVGSIGNIFKSIVNGILRGINAVIRQPFNFINGILNRVSGISVLGARPFGWIGYNPLPVPQIPYLDVGTNYVARDGLAMIHQGEAVVPKKYNPAVNGNSGEQVELLKEQNALLRQLLEKDNSVYLDSDKLHQSNERKTALENYRLGISY